jgi:lysozyme
VAPAKKKSPLTKRSSPKARTKKGISVKWMIALAAVLLLALSPFYYKNLIRALPWAKNSDADAYYPIYKNFHIRIPNRYGFHGIDVSSYQGTIDWGKVKNMKEDSVHISFAYIKATEGLRQVDPFFERNWRKCQKSGICCGAYHYFEPKLSGRWQAAFFLQHIKLQKGDLPAAVDIEELDGIDASKMRLELNDFLKEVTSKTNTKPVIYSGLRFYRDNLAGYFDDYALWISSYDHPELAVNQAVPWKFWQHSEKARVNGIVHGVDFDVFKGDTADFRQMLVR